MNKRLNEIEQRLSAIKSELDLEGADIKALSDEADSLIEERKTILADIETRKNTLNKIANGEKGQVIDIMPQTTEERTYGLDSAEQRSGFLKSLIGKELNKEERAAIALNGAVPHVQMQNSIIAKVKEMCPVANHVTMLSVPGYVKFVVEGTTAAAEDHTENATITAKTDTFVTVEITPTEIVKLVQISDSASTMSIDALEAFIINNIAASIAASVEAKLLTAMLAGATSVATTITTDTVLKLFGSLSAGYARNSKVYVNRTTLYGTLVGLQDKSKNDLVVREGNAYKLLGVEVVESPSVPVGTVLLCDPTKMVADMAENINVKKGFDLDHNAYKFLGVAIFGCKLAIADAFKKIVVTG